MDEQPEQPMHFWCLHRDASYVELVEFLVNTHTVSVQEKVDRLLRKWRVIEKEEKMGGGN